MTNPFEKMLHLHSEDAAAEEKEVKPLTVRQLEDIQIFLEQADARTLLGMESENVGPVSPEKGRQLIGEFQEGEQALDSNTKRKMYGRIKDIFIEKVENAVELLDAELRELENEKPETVGKKIEFDSKLHEVKEGVGKLKDFKFWDLTELKHLEDRLAKLEVKD